MIFFFKKKPIVLHCVTDRQDLLKLAPIQNTVKFLPDWWKQLPGALRDDAIHDWPTMKHCTGYVDLYKSGITIPMWSDLSLVVGEEGTTGYQYQFADKMTNLICHSPDQYGNYFDIAKYQHFKIGTPWFFVCEEDIKFLFVEPTWTFLKFPTLKILPGVIDFKYQTSGNINLFVRRTAQRQEILLPFLEPVAQIIPLSERPLKINMSDDPELLKRVATFRFQNTFLHRYKNAKKAFKKFQENK